MIVLPRKVHELCVIMNFITLHYGFSCALMRYFELVPHAAFNGKAFKMHSD